MNKPYRIFHLIKGLGRGGAERLLSEGLPYVDKEKFVSGYGYFLPWKNALVSELRKNGAEVVCFNSKNPVTMLFSTPRVARFLRRWRPDLIHCHLPLSGIVGRLAGRTIEVPVVYTEHNLLERYHAWTRRANLWTWKWQTSVVAVSNQVAASIHSHINSAVPVQVIHNGVAVETLSPSRSDRIAIRQQLNIPLDAPVVGTVAAFRMQKKLDDWLQAAQIIKECFPKSHFLLVGDGPLSANLKNQVHTHQLDDRVHFTGSQETVTPYYSAMDVFMSSSIFEGLPIALLEAMSMNVPVVATTVGGIPEVITDGHTGFLVEPRTPNMLAQKVITLLGNEELRKTFGLAGRVVVEQRFSIRRMTAELEQLYMEILGNKSRNAMGSRIEGPLKHLNSSIVN